MRDTFSSLKDRLALVTGAGSGIGEMLAKQLARAGMRVAVQDIREADAARVASEIGDQAFPLVFDVSDRDACFEAAETLRNSEHTLNLVWMNAGVGIGASILGASQRSIEWGFGVNVLGIIWTAQAFVPLLKTSDGPKHLGITSSSAALVSPRPPFPLYATTKHGTMAVGEALSAEVAGEGIETTILCPGLLNTKIWDGARARPDRFGGPQNMDPSISAQWDAARDPDVMWPHIRETIETGGGYVVCTTDDDAMEGFEARNHAIRNAERPVYDTSKS